VVRTGEPNSFERFSAPLGRYYDVHAFKPDEGRFAALFLDVTDRRQAEEEIKAVARFPAENPHPVMRISNDGKVLYANKPSERLLSRSGAATGRLAPQFLHGLVEQAFAKRSTVIVDVPHAKRVWSFTVTPIVGSGYATSMAVTSPNASRPRSAERASKGIALS
jgi:PAS domain-containing protein